MKTCPRARKRNKKKKRREKNDVVVKKNDGDGVKRYHTSLSGMPHFDKANAALD
mgnify:CR=1 FL=1